MSARKNTQQATGDRDAPGGIDGARSAGWRACAATVAAILGLCVATASLAADTAAPTPAQRTCAAPERCVDALVQALKARDRAAALALLGPGSGPEITSGDAVADKELHDVILRADIVSPWNVGRYGSPEEVARQARQKWKPDVEWCSEKKKEYLPVVFPGFSWHNMKPTSQLDQIPRRKGQFLWSQFVQAKQAGAMMIYVAMFDEMDEGTAIFKITNNPPAGESKFVTYEGLPSDHYLWLTGMGRKLLRGELKATDLPERK